MTSPSKSLPVLLNGPTAEQLAWMFHDAYERLAPSFGYKTREASAVPWDQVPDANRRLMVAVAAEILTALGAAGGGTCAATSQLDANVSALTCDLPPGHDGDWHYRNSDGVEWRMEMSPHVRYASRDTAGGGTRA